MSDIQISLQRYMGRPIQEVVEEIHKFGLKPVVMRPGTYTDCAMIFDRVKITEENGVVTRITHG